MNSKYVSIFLILLSGIAIWYAYTQKNLASFYANERNEIHRQLVRVRNEADASRVEAAKLRDMVDRSLNEINSMRDELSKCKKR